MLGRDLLQFLWLQTIFTSIWTFCRKTATRFRINRRCDFAFQDDSIHLSWDVGRENYRKQCFCIGMVLFCKQFLRRAGFHQLPRYITQISSEIYFTTDKSWVLCGCRIAQNRLSRITGCHLYQSKHQNGHAKNNRDHQADWFQDIRKLRHLCLTNSARDMAVSGQPYPFAKNLLSVWYGQIALSLPAEWYWHGWSGSSP